MDICDKGVVFALFFFSQSSLIPPTYDSTQLPSLLFSLFLFIFFFSPYVLHFTTKHLMRKRERECDRDKKKRKNMKAVVLFHFSYFSQERSGHTQGVEKSDKLLSICCQLMYQNILTLFAEKNQYKFISIPSPLIIVNSCYHNYSPTLSFPCSSHSAHTIILLFLFSLSLCGSPVVCGQKKKEKKSNKKKA
jgi:hypothetical protein